MNKKRTFVKENKVILFVMIVLTLPISVPILLIWGVIENIKSKRIIDKWSNILKRKEATQLESEQVFEDVNSLFYIINHPDQWGKAKQIYYGIINSNDVKYETKVKIFDLFDDLELRGIRIPKKNRGEK